MEENLQKVAQQFFINGDFENAKNIYMQLGMDLEVAYCDIYLGNLKRAKKNIENLSKDSPVAEWINSFVQMIEANLTDMPSYLQIRNFFEIDLSNLFINEQYSYIENVINYVPVLASVNGEIYKLAARVLKNNNQDELARNFLGKSLEICFNDSETHYMLAELYLKYDDKETAIRHLNYACESGEYYPATKLLNLLK